MDIVLKVKWVESRPLSFIHLGMQCIQYIRDLTLYSSPVMLSRGLGTQYLVKYSGQCPYCHPLQYLAGGLGTMYLTGVSGPCVPISSLTIAGGYVSLPCVQ